MELDAACSRCAPSPRNDDAMAPQPTGRCAAVWATGKVDPRGNSGALVEAQRRPVERSVGAGGAQCNCTRARWDQRSWLLLLLLWPAVLLCAQSRWSETLAAAWNASSAITNARIGVKIYYNNMKLNCLSSDLLAIPIVCMVMEKHACREIVVSSASHLSLLSLLLHSLTHSHNHPYSIRSSP